MGAYQVFDLNKIRTAMEQGIILMKYTSLMSGDTSEREFTLKPEFTNGMIVKNEIADKLVCYDVEFQKWADIESTTIISWKTVE